MTALRNAIRVTLALYLVATWTSMAGMEIFGWLTFLFIVVYAARKPSDIRASDIGEVMPWKSCLLLLLITALGFIVNGTETAEPVDHIGSQRWMFLLATHAFALALWLPSWRGYRLFLGVISIVGVYGVFQSITGIDLLRPGSHRAVQPITENMWRSAGLFGSPLQYAYIAGQHVCLPLAVVLLGWTKKKELGWKFSASLAAVCLVGASLVTTYTRGAWISMSVAWLVMAWLTRPKIAISLAAGGATVLAILIATVETIRDRFMSLFTMDYASNSERWFLWKANWAMFLDYPILGIGYQENETRAREYVTRLGRPDAFTGHAHNNYLQMLSGTGITGFLTYMFIISYMLWLTWRLWKSLPENQLWPRALALGALGAQIHLHIGGFTEANFKAGATSHNTMVVWAIVIALTVLNKKKLLGSDPRLS